MTTREGILTTKLVWQPHLSLTEFWNEFKKFSVCLLEHPRELRALQCSLLFITGFPSHPGAEPGGWTPFNQESEQQLTPSC